MIKKQKTNTTAINKNDDDEGEFNTNFFTKVKKREKRTTYLITFYSTKRFWMFESQKSK